MYHTFNCTKELFNECRLRNHEKIECTQQIRTNNGTHEQVLPAFNYACSCSTCFSLVSCIGSLFSRDASVPTGPGLHLWSRCQTATFELTYSRGVSFVLQGLPISLRFLLPWFTSFLRGQLPPQYPSFLILAFLFSTETYPFYA